MSNVNPDTGVRYGVIALNNLDSELGQELMFGAKAKDLTYLSAYAEAEAKAQQEADEAASEQGISDDELESFCEDRVEAAMEQFTDTWQCDEPTIEGTHDDVKYQVSWLGGAPLLWVLHSPHIVHANRLCSPCVPNAADLDSGLATDGTGFECYGIPDDWMPSAQLNLLMERDHA